MPQVISLCDALHKRRETPASPPTRRDRSGLAAALFVASRPVPNDKDIDRAIMLLDAAAEQARLLVMQANDPTSGNDVETRAASIVQLLGLARSVTSRLE
jgi:hypothetical protein